MLRSVAPTMLTAAQMQAWVLLDREMTLMQDASRVVTGGVRRQAVGTTTGMMGGGADKKRDRCLARGVCDK